MANPQTSTSIDTASALQWLVATGLDSPVSDRPRNWLSEPAVPVQAKASPKIDATPRPITPIADGIESLSALDAALRTMNHPLDNGAPRLFAGEQCAPLLVLAEMPMDPQSEEARLLTAMLAAVGFGQRQSASVCILPWPTRGQRPGRDADIALFSPFVRRALTLMSPRLILGLGGRAASLADPDAPPATLRGRWLSLGDTPMVATFTPAMLLRQPRLKADAWADLQRLSERLPA